MKSTRLVIVVIVVSTIVLGCSLVSNSPRLRTHAPDFSLWTVGGRQVQLNQFQGRLVLVNFWATWCNPCLEEMPLFQERYVKYYPDLVILAVEEGSSVREVRQVMNRVKITFPVLMGTQETLSSYGIRAYPTSFLVDREGIIRDQQIGTFAPHQLDATLKELGLE